ncbi:MAG: hypothetical protein ABJZ83_12865 [Yoonia sp.]|uniref:hypothetical protein n=1 Tax=Yoonia sp. TaxID=2212373 RepID=UPI00329946FB
MMLIDELRLQCLWKEDQERKISRPTDQKRSFNRTILEHFHDINLKKVYSPTSKSSTEAYSGLAARWYLVQAIEAGYLTGYPKPGEIRIFVGCDACHSCVTTQNGCNAAVGSALPLEDIWIASKEPIDDDGLKAYANVEWKLEGLVADQWQTIHPMIPMSQLGNLPYFTPAGDAGHINSTRRKFLF